MKMRAKMVDGSPVTFESIDHGGLKYRLNNDSELKVCPPYTTEFVGEGFHVISKWSGQAMYLDQDDLIGYPRLAYDRWSLARSGVDTATVEYLDRFLEHRFDRPIPIDLREHWERMWPEPSLKGTPATFMPVTVTYMGEDNLVTEDMLLAGAAMLEDMTVRHATIDRGKVWFRSPSVVVTNIWRAMQKARR